ncbi:putative membrane protein YfcA [Pseudarthrobacter defluvii]|uniref:hypothetical protein n=1 Tax=Pseudarthrobacter defluvii TaxID=410837 RepID=UPI00278878C3|nr:hypothetical protein [Pseudarthrobacter defluvii]MDQ0769904.1 putative membrane protein YfcA [Pseudarthrobacter defluvii]
MDRKPHRNGRGLFLGAVLGAVVGYFAGRAVGNPAMGIVLGLLAGAAVLYRVNPGSRKPGPRKKDCRRPGAGK